MSPLELEPHYGLWSEHSGHHKQAEQVNYLKHQYEIELDLAGDQEAVKSSYET